MRPATRIILFILITAMAVKVAPLAKRKKFVRVPFSPVRNPNFQPPTAVFNTASKLSRRAISNMPLISYQEELWLADVSVGNPRQNFKFVVNTGGGDTWVADLQCGGNCGTLPQYNGGASSTFHDLNKPFDVKYAGGAEASGFWTADDVALGSVVIPQQQFGRAKVIPPTMMQVGASGHLGLGFSSRGTPDMPAIIEQLLKQHLIDDNVVSFRFVKNNAGQAGEMVFGGVEDQFVNGDIQFTSISVGADGPDWTIPIADVELAGKSIEQSATAYLLTSTGHIFVSDDVATSVYAKVPGSEKGSDGVWVAPQPFPFDVGFVIGQRTFTVPAADLLMNYKVGDKFVGVFQGGRDNLWLIGNAFIKNHYLVFDFGFNDIGIGDRSDL